MHERAGCHHWIDASSSRSFCRFPNDPVSDSETTSHQSRVTNHMKTKRKPKPDKLAIAVSTITMLTVERQAYRSALIDLLAFWDRVPKAIEPRDGYFNEADAKRLDEIRKLVTP